MDDTVPSQPEVTLDVPGLSHILTPGSSLHPTFLLVVDGVFAFLLLILFLLAFTTRSVHFIALIFISLGLWASVKWFVNELKRAPPADENNSSEPETKKDS